MSGGVVDLAEWRGVDNCAQRAVTSEEGRRLYEAFRRIPDAKRRELVERSASKSPGHLLDSYARGYKPAGRGAAPSPYSAVAGDFCWRRCVSRGCGVVSLVIVVVAVRSRVVFPVPGSPSTRYKRSGSSPPH